MPENTIRNKMRLDGIKKEFQDMFFGVGGNANAGGNKKEEKKDEVKEEKVKLDKALERYYDMYFSYVEKGLGMPELIIKMKKDKVKPDLIQQLKQVIDDLPVDNIEVKIPLLNKYTLMIEKGLSKNAAIGKMKLDGVDKKLIQAFENPNQKKKHKFSDLFHIKRHGKPKIKPKTDLKRLHWEKIDSKKAKNSIWKNIDETIIKIDIKGFEYAFSSEDPKKKAEKEKKKKQKAKNKGILFIY